ncbi:AraC family transcriptional regulator [Falsiroseomonas sp. HW251]|uniref:AraC family transcriptional regulator n=1 Tax=Falsiroseomonas sp. HW251 TaxID=3390998 RepID=UPI003D317B8D
MLPLVRSAALTGYSSVARSFGLEPERLAKEVGLPRLALERPDLRVPVAQVANLLELSASTAGIEDFGVRLGETRRISNLGLLGVIATEAPNLREGTQAIARYVRLHSEALSLRLVPLEASCIISPGIFVPHVDRVRQLTEMVLAVAHRGFHELFGELWQPELVCFPHPAPHDLSSQRRIFGVPLQFDAVVTGFVCSRESIERRRAVSDSLLVREASARLDELLARNIPGTTARARQTIAWLLPTGLCSAAAVAERLGLGERTLHRHLAREKTSYARLIDEVRQDLARQHLSSGRRPLKELAAALGFEASSALSRWFRSRFGCSATEWNRKAAEGQAHKQIASEV